MNNIRKNALNECDILCFFHIRFERIVDILCNILNIMYNYVHKENEYIHKYMYIYTQ